MKLSKHSTIYTIVLCLMVCVVLVAASAPASAQIVLRLLVWEGYTPAEKVSQFENMMRAKYNKPVKLEISHDVSDPQDFFAALRRRGGAHIISPAHNVIKDERFDFIAKQLAAPLDLNNIPHYKNLLNTLQHADYITDEKRQVYGVPYAHGPYGLAYNTALVTEPPDSWNVLWDPRYKGKYAISADYYEANIYITAIAMGFDKNLYYSYDALNQSANFKVKLRQLAQNAGRFWTGVDTVTDLKGMHLATTWGFCLDELGQQGEIWKIAEPKEGNTGWVDNFVIGSRNLGEDPLLKQLAEEFLNFVISPEYQAEVVVRQLGSDPVNTEVKNILSPEEIQKHHLDEPDYFNQNRILWPIISERHRNGLQLFWKEANE